MKERPLALLGGVKKKKKQENDEKMKHRCTRASKQKIPTLIQFLMLYYSLSDSQTETVMKKATMKTRLTSNTHTLTNSLDHISYLNASS